MSTLRIEMLSDWHIGTGAGIPGSIDAMLAGDGDGFPCVPAKTIIGIWRDAMETLTLGLDNGDPNNKVWQKWVDVIFGSQPIVDKIPTETPRPSILSIEPARLNENLRGAIGNDTKLKQALTFIKPNTAIDSDSGTAKSESLRMTEMGRIGTVLGAEFKLDYDMFESVQPDEKELVEALLVASAALVERIGGNRRRGSGRCKMQVEGEGLRSIEAAVETIKNFKTVQKIPDVKRHANNAEVAPSANGDGWKRIKYSLRLHTPVAIVTNTLGNVSETLDFIPGTYLLPHITRRLNGISKYVASGDFQVSPATIQIEVPKKDDKGESQLLEERGLPVPKVIFYHKVDGGFDKCIKDKKQEGEKPTVYNLIMERDKVEDLTYQKKNYREGYVSSIDGSGTLPFYETTKRILLMHNTVNDQIQRPDETVGGVYSRQAIKAGTTLRGEIRLKKSIAEELAKQGPKWFEKLNGSVRIGTSKKDDYGLAELKIEELVEDTSNAVANSNELIVYLESDVLLRNGNLRQTNLIDELKTELEKKLGENSLNKRESDSLIQIRRIESWHEGWGFPRPTLIAMQAGSCVKFEIQGFDKLTDEGKKKLTKNLQEIENSGIGERRGEGYGRIRFNPPLLSSKINEWKVASKNGSKEEKRKQQQRRRDEALAKLKTEIINADKLKKFVETIELAAWRDEMARAVLKIADDKHQRMEIFGFDSPSKIPPMSQIGGFRSAIGRLEKPKDQNVLGWIAHLEATGNRLEKWGKNNNKDEARKKLERIKELINDGHKVWLILCDSKLNGQNVWSTPNKLVQDGDSLRKALWAEAVKSLLDACARAHKRDLERDDTKEVSTNG